MLAGSAPQAAAVGPAPPAAAPPLRTCPPCPGPAQSTNPSPRCARDAGAAASALAVDASSTLPRARQILPRMAHHRKVERRLRGRCPRGRWRRSGRRTGTGLQQLFPVGPGHKAAGAGKSAALQQFQPGTLAGPRSRAENGVPVSSTQPSAPGRRTPRRGLRARPTRCRPVRPRRAPGQPIAGVVQRGGQPGRGVNCSIRSSACATASASRAMGRLRIKHGVAVRLHPGPLAPAGIQSAGTGSAPGLPGSRHSGRRRGSATPASAARPPRSPRRTASVRAAGRWRPAPARRRRRRPPQSRAAAPDPDRRSSPPQRGCGPARWRRCRGGWLGAPAKSPAA